MKKVSWEELNKQRVSGKVFVLPTDTVYGFHCFVDDKKAIKKLKKIKERKNQDFFIILISDISDIEDFNILLKESHKDFLRKNWPAKLTVVLKDIQGRARSFRIPDKEELRYFIEQNGPIYSTSANRHGEATKKTPGELDEQLQSQIGFYVDEGKLESAPSILIDFLR